MLFTIANALLILLNLSPILSSFVLPDIRLSPHPYGYIEKVLVSTKSRMFNHNHVGLINSEAIDIPEGFRVLEKKINLGKGSKTFDLASSVLLRFDMINLLPWAKIVVLRSQPIILDSPLATLIKCYSAVWSLNPCRVVCLQKNVKANNERITQIGFSTVTGHLIAGEERFTVRMDSTGCVTYEMFSFTKGAGLLGQLSMPLIRPLQNRFFKEQSEMLLKILDKEP